jgi:hypothetical protein
VKSFAALKHGHWKAKFMAESIRHEVYPLWVKDSELAAIEEILALDL